MPNRRLSVVEQFPGEAPPIKMPKREEVAPLMEEIKGQQAVFDLFERLFPQLFDVTRMADVPAEDIPYRAVEFVESWAEEEPEKFLGYLREKGRTPDTERILGLFGAREEDLEQMLAPVPTEPIPAEGMQFVEEVEGIRKLFTIRPDYSVELEGKIIGTYKPETGEILPEEITTIELAKRNMQESWRRYTTGEFTWGEFGQLALGTLMVGGAYIEKYVGRPWEAALLSTRIDFLRTVGLDSELDRIARQRLDEVVAKYGWAGALIAEDISAIWHDYVEGLEGPAKPTLKVVEWLNPAYVIPIGGTFGLAARFTSKIPLLGKVMKWTASGVQATERGIMYPVAKPLEVGVRYGAKGAEAVGKRLGESLSNKLIKQTDNLLLEIPETERLLDGVLVDNWMKRALTLAAKIPPVKVGIEKALGWRILARRESQVIEDVVSRGAVVHAEISRMGVNAKALKYWELQDISRNPVRLFGFNKNAVSTRVKRLVPEADGTLEDIFTHPERYALSDRQLEYATRVHEINTEVLNLLKKEGVPPEHVIDDWMHRVVVTEGKPLKAGKAVGAKPSYEKPRKFETMAEGIEWFMKHPDLQAKYAISPEILISDYIQGAFKKIADNRFVRYIEQFGGVTPAERLAERFPELVERAALTQVELADAARFGSVINRSIRGEKIPVQTISAIQRRFPELGRKFRQLAQEPVKAEVQLRELLAQNEKTIRQLKARIEKAEAIDIEAIKAGAREEAIRIGIPDEQKLTEAFRLMDYDDRLAFRSTMESQADDIGKMLYEEQAEIEGLMEWLATEPATKLVNFVKRAGWYKGEVSNLTIVQYKKLSGKSPLPNILTKDKKHVRWEYALDDAATEMGYESGEALKGAIEKALETQLSIDDLKILADIGKDRLKGINRMMTVLNVVDNDIRYVPKAAPGMPEAGIQKDIFGYETPHFPKGKGEITQISMDDYGKLAKARKDAGLPPPDVGIKPKIDGIKGFETETTFKKVTTTPSEIKTTATREAELKALRTEVKTLTESRKAPYWQAKAEKALQMEKVRQPELGEGYIMQPFAGGKIYDQEFIDGFNKFFGHKGGLPALQVTSDVAGILRITKAALDFSQPAIQGLPSWGLAHAYLLIGPPTGMRLLGAWYKTFVQSTASFFRPEVLAAAIKKIRPEAMQRIQFGGSARAVDYFQVLWQREGLAGAFQKAAGKIPFKPYDRAEICFFGAGELCRDRFWKILAPKAIRNGKEFELARFLDRFTGITDSASLGVPLTVRQLEQTFAWFAPNYTRACLTVLADVFRGGYTGAMARESLGGMIAAGSAMYCGVQYSIASLNGKSDGDAWKAVEEGFGVVTDPITKEVSWKPTGQFMTLKVGNYNMGFGGFWYGLLRLSGNIMACVDEVGDKEVIDLVRIMKNGSFNKKDNPFIYWWYSRASPLFGTGFEMASGKDFLGYPIESAEDYMQYIATRFEPIWMEQGLNWMIPGMARDHEIPEDAARVAVIPAEIFGLRTFPESQWLKFYDKANTLIKNIPEEELDPKQVDAWREGTLTWKQLTDIQKMNLLSRYPELEDIYSESQADSAVRGSDNWKQWEGRMTEEKDTYYSRGDSLVDRLKTGEFGTREFREFWSDAGQNYGVALESIEKEPTYEDIYNYFDNKEAKGEKYGFLDNIALQEYINIAFADYLDSKGDIDWDAKDLAIDEFIERWGDDTYQRIRQMYADKKMLEGLDPMLIRLADDKDNLGREYWRLPYKPYYEMDEEDLAEGNIPPAFLPLWEKYQELETDEDRDAFLQSQPLFAKDWRAEYRLNNPENDARLALWGYGGKLKSMEAYDLVTKWGRELGIPLEQMGLGLPPRSIIKDYFELNKVVTETSGGSIEAKLFKLEHTGYLAWGIEQGIWKDDLSGENAEILRHRIELKALEEGTDEYSKLSRRIEGLEREVPATLIEDYIEYYSIPLKGYDNERYLMEHKELYQFMVDSEIWQEKDFSKVPTKKFEETYNEIYSKLDKGTERYEFRGAYPWFDEEGVKLGHWKAYEAPKPKTETEAKRKSRSELYQEFDKKLKELEEKVSEFGQ